jgi:hypothetical protein
VTGWSCDDAEHYRGDEDRLARLVGIALSSRMWKKTIRRIPQGSGKLGNMAVGPIVR